jgi:hypothetical protein
MRSWKRGRGEVGREGFVRSKAGRARQEGKELRNCCGGEEAEGGERRHTVIAGMK